MNPIKKKLLFLPLLAVVLMRSDPVMSQMSASPQFTTLHDFASGSDGANPYAGLALSGNTLYGTTLQGGTNGLGSVFKINTDGTCYKVLKSFAGGADGSSPYCDLVISGNTLFGTTHDGQYTNGGTVFALNTNGSGYTVLKNFVANPDGGKLSAGLTLSGNTLYGVASFGGANTNYPNGTIFALTFTQAGTNQPVFSSYTVLHDFSVFTNASGTEPVDPYSTLLLSGGTLYGTTGEGGTGSSGTVFKLNTDGSGFTNLHVFSKLNLSNADGFGPFGGLSILGNTLYGTAIYGGVDFDGTLFSINTDGSGFKVLEAFPDSGNPVAGLAVSGRTLYGTTLSGGQSGTFFGVNADGTGYFEENFNGTASRPLGKAVITGDKAFFTMSQGGFYGYGTIYQTTIPVTLYYQQTSNALVLIWNDPSFILQAAPTANSSYTNVPGATSPYTNTFSAPGACFRLLVSH